jgi:hypothetical protein
VTVPRLMTPDPAIVPICMCIVASEGNWHTEISRLVVDGVICVVLVSVVLGKYNSLEQLDLLCTELTAMPQKRWTIISARNSMVEVL